MRHEELAVLLALAVKHPIPQFVGLAAVVAFFTLMDAINIVRIKRKTAVDPSFLDERVAGRRRPPKA